MTKTEDRRTIIFHESKTQILNDYVVGIIKMPTQQAREFAIYFQQEIIGKPVRYKIVTSFHITDNNCGIYTLEASDNVAKYTFIIDYKFIGTMLKEPKYFKANY